MTDTSFTVTVTRDLEDLIPGFMKNRRSELDSLRAAFQGGDFEKLRQLGHRMKGVGNSYGFARISALGIQIEDGARGRDAATLEASISNYAEYLDKVTIVYA
jgi:HPt (histidine-containing phosphotransfer) domain-containing protein